MKRNVDVVLHLTIEEPIDQEPYEDDHLIADIRHALGNWMRQTNTIIDSVEVVEPK